MFDVKKCPTADELKQMLLGRLSAARTATIEDHLDGCNLCLAAVGKLEIESQIVDALQTQPSLKLAAVPADLEELMATLDTLHPGSDSRSPSDPEDLPVLIRGDDCDELGRLAQFRVLTQLGAGGMGVVYLAKDTKLQRSVALKVLRPRTARDPDARARFLREARAVASIKHDHVVVVHEVGEADAGEGEATMPYLAMELLDGVSLLTWMRDHRRPPLLTVVRLGRQIAEALAALHARGLVHRDVKPGNLWLEQDRHPNITPADPLDLGKLKLLDFGLAATSSDAVAEARALGTPAYMAPEQFRGDAVDSRCDLFGLGCILYELCTGEHPFPDRRISADHTTPFPASDLNPLVPASLSKLIAQMLREDPAERPDSARRIVRELSAIEATLAGLDKTPARNGRRRIALGLALVAVAAVCGVWFRASHTPPPTAPIEAVAPADPLVDAWCDEIRVMTAQKQWNAVGKRLEELNPGFSRKKSAGWVEPEAVLRFSERTDILHDVRPIRCLADLKSLKLTGSKPGSGKLTEIASLRPLHLHTLNISNNPELHDLTALAKMPLVNLDISHTAVSSLAPLAQPTLQDLRLAYAPVQDLGPVRMLKKLHTLDVTGCPIDSLEPLLGSAVRELKIDLQPGRDLVLLKKLPLQTLDLSGTTLASLTGLEGLAVTELCLARTPVKDLGPLRSMSKLRSLDISGCRVDSLEPLVGLPLEEIKLDLQNSHDTAILIGLASLKKINGAPVQEFWKNQTPDD